jgi:transcriptional regulator with XRE-family HTH domain
MLEKMGSFLAVLRKAKGFSQMELAELLNVPDKTVSRWERGKGSSDLCLIPVLVDILELTSDELLREERIHPAKTSPEDLRKQDQVSRKQSKRILRLQESRFKNRSFFVTFMAQALVNDRLDSSNFSPGTSFADFESFKTFMEKEEAADLYDDQLSSTVDY